MELVCQQVNLLNFFNFKIKKGKCKCPAGFNSSDGCQKCQNSYEQGGRLIINDGSFDGDDVTELFTCATLSLNNFRGCNEDSMPQKCAAFCGIGECYIPGKQKKCDLAPACNYHGSCKGAPSGIGQCICDKGYDPKFYCKVKI